MMLEGLGRVRVVLVRTSHPGNIGAAARALRVMGLARLYLVAPSSFPHPEANAFAAGADQLLDAAIVCASLGEAIADCRWVIGATARSRSVALSESAPREIAARIVQQAGAGDEVALVFGNERSGLSNDELTQCHAAVCIPADAEFSSLNLAQAVQVLAYELRLAALAAIRVDQPVTPAAGAQRAAADSERAASAQDMEGFFGHLDRALLAIDFYKGRPSGTLLRRFRRLFFRSAPSYREVMLLRGVLADAERMARLAAEAGGCGIPADGGSTAD